MSSLVAQYRQIEAQIKTLKSELQMIEARPEFAEDLAFLQSLDALMNDYGKSAGEVLRILNPSGVDSQRGPGARRGMRKQTTYKNPHTGETVTTAGGNHKVLKEWKKQYPETNIKEWIVGGGE